MGLVLPAGRAGAVYAARAGSLMRSEDGGQTWAPLPGSLPAGQAQALAVDPRGADRVYAIVGGALVRSDDAGTTWTRLPGPGVGAGPASLVVVPEGPDVPRTLFAATRGGGVLASADDGATWANANGFVNGALPDAPVRSLAYDPQSGDRFEGVGGTRFAGALYAGSDAGLFKSTDGGASWNRLPLNARVAAVAVSPAEPRVVLVADDQGRLFRSDDGGQTWPGGAAS